MTLSWGYLIPLVVLAAAAICAGLIAVIRPLLARYALARPNGRSSHIEPTPQGGGIAVIGTTIAVALVAGYWMQIASISSATSVAWVLAAAVLIAAVGLVDDIRTVQVAPRLLIQTLAAGVMVAALPAELRALPFLPWWIERLVLLLGTLWLVNLVNFMDGLDWMTVAEVVPLTGALVVLGAVGALPITATIIALALLGAMIGFAPFNRPVARLFLGDVGSLPIGLLLGWLLISLAGSGHLAAAIILPLYYLADATLTLLRRLLNREPVWQAHRLHFYQRARDSGFSVFQIVGCVFVLNLCLAALSIATVTAKSAIAAVAALFAAAALVGWLLVVFARGKR